MPILLQEDMERPLPKLYRVRQQFDDSRLEDVAGAVAAQCRRPEIAALVKPGARVAAKESPGGNIGVIGTAGTVGSHIYREYIQSLRPEAQVFEKACDRICADIGENA